MPAEKFVVVMIDLSIMIRCMEIGDLIPMMWVVVVFSALSCSIVFPLGHPPI
jgi:hypothetical protein